MKEVKFKAWDIEKRCFLKPKAYLDKEGNIYITLDGKIVFEVVKKSNYDIYNNALTLKPVDASNRFILLQYTGIKDKDGQEIYEGDVIEHNGEKYLVEHIDKFLKYIGFCEAFLRIQNY